MLCMTHYTREHIEACRAQVNAQVDAFKALAATGADTSAIEAAHFNNMVIFLETCFTHRSRAKEGKDGNPLNEVRVLSSSLTGNFGRLAVDKVIKWKPETTVLGYAAGDEISVRAADFERLAKGYFAELEAKYLEV
jgi:hypothetical protein